MAFPSLLKFLIRGSSSGRLLSFTTFHAFGGIGISVSSPIRSFRDLELELDDLELELDDLELELGLDRDLGLPLSGAPGGDDGVLDPMSLPGAADDLDGLLEGDLDGLLEGDLDGLLSTLTPSTLNPGGNSSRTVRQVPTGVARSSSQTLL